MQFLQLKCLSSKLICLLAPKYRETLQFQPAHAKNLGWELMGISDDAAQREDYQGGDRGCSQPKHWQIIDA